VLLTHNGQVIRRNYPNLRIIPCSLSYFAWKANPASKRDKEDQRLLVLLKQSWLESGGVYGYLQGKQKVTKQQVLN